MWNFNKNKEQKRGRKETNNDKNDNNNIQHIIITMKIITNDKVIIM